jgi:hypothetical protein
VFEAVDLPERGVVEHELITAGRLDPTVPAELRDRPLHHLALDLVAVTIELENRGVHSPQDTSSRARSVIDCADSRRPGACTLRRSVMPIWGPTFAEMRDPARLPESFRRLALVASHQAPLDPVNLFNITWKLADGTVNGFLFPKALTGVHTLVFPSTGNFGIGGSWVGPRLGLSLAGRVARRDERASASRRSAGSAADVIATPGCESNVKEIYDKVKRAAKANAREPSSTSSPSSATTASTTGSRPRPMAELPEASIGDRQGRRLRERHGLGGHHRRGRPAEGDAGHVHRRASSPCSAPPCSTTPASARTASRASATNTSPGSTT